MPVIGVIGRKGGSGKTTIAVHLAAELATGKRTVAVVDADSMMEHWEGGAAAMGHARLRQDRAAAWACVIPGGVGRVITRTGDAKPANTAYP